MGGWNLKSHQLIFFFGALGGLLFGFDQGVISGVLLFIRNDIPLTNVMEGIVVSCLLFGAIIGAASGGWISDKLGRRKAIALVAIIFILGTIGSALSVNASSLITARIINGLGVGGSMAIIPVYLAELAPTRMRGSLTALNQLMITIGVLIAYISNYFLTPFEAWRWMLAVCSIPGIIIIIGIIYMPESPRWLLQNRKESQARKIMSLVRSEGEIETELKDIKKINNESNESAYKIIKSKWIRPSLIIAILLGIFQQIVGINAVLYYAPSIFAKSGMGNYASTLGTVGIGVVNVVMTVVAILTIDKLGRKKLLCIGSIAMSISLIFLSIILITLGLKPSTSLLVLLFLSIYVMSFAVSWGAVVWVLLPELFPLKARGVGTGISTMFINFSNLVVTLLFPILLSSVGIGPIFITFTIICIISLIFVLMFVPETTGRSLEEIENDIKNIAKHTSI